MSKQTRKKSSTLVAAKKPIGKPATSTKPAKKPAAKSASAATAKSKAVAPARGTTRKPAAEPSRPAPAKAVKPSRGKAAATKAPAPVAKRTPKPAKAKEAATQLTVTAKPVTAKPAVAKEAAAKPVAAKLVPAKPTAPPAEEPRKGVLSEGSKAPVFELPRDGGGTVSLQSFAGRKLVIFFYPRASTPGCTKEAIEFTRLVDDFAAAGTGVLGISADSPKAQDSFRDKYQLTTPLLSDETHQILEAYGVWGEKSMYGKVFQGILRSTVLIGADGRVAKIWRNVKVDGHADAVLAAARELE